MMYMNIAFFSLSYCLILAYVHCFIWNSNNMRSNFKDRIFFIKYGTSQIYRKQNQIFFCEDKSVRESENEQTSIIQQYYNEAIMMLGKVSVNRLRKLIIKYKESVLPDSESDVEAHLHAALDASWTWACDNGEWEGLVTMLRNELSSEAELSTKHLETALLSGRKLTESRLKSLITKYDSVNSLPKLDKIKYKGKFLKDDYITTLIDILREQNANDYEKVALILVEEGKRGDDKGFGMKK